MVSILVKKAIATGCDPVGDSDGTPEGDPRGVPDGDSDGPAEGDPIRHSTGPTFTLASPIYSIYEIFDNIKLYLLSHHIVFHRVSTVSYYAAVTLGTHFVIWR